jgi:hypothetical protein
MTAHCYTIIRQLVKWTTASRRDDSDNNNRKKLHFLDVYTDDGGSIFSRRIRNNIPGYTV